MKKKLIAVLLMSSLIFTATACNGGNKDTQTTDTETVETQSEDTETTASAEEETADISAPEETEDADLSINESEDSSASSAISEENKQLIYDTMQAIYDVGPGSSGSSLRTMIAAGKLLDLAETLTDKVDPSELTQVAADWAKENEKTEGIFDEAYTDVRETAFDYLDNPEKYEDTLKDCGYEFTHDTHTRAYLEYVTNYIEISRATGE